MNSNSFRSAVQFVRIRTDCNVFDYKTSRGTSLFLIRTTRKVNSHKSKVRNNAPIVALMESNLLWEAYAFLGKKCFTLRERDCHSLGSKAISKPNEFLLLRLKNIHLIPLLKKITVRGGAFRTPALVSARRPFYSAFVPAHKSFTSLVTTRKSYARGARTGGRFISRNLGQREKITRLSRRHITSVATRLEKTNPLGRVTRLRASVIKLHRLFKR